MAMLIFAFRNVANASKNRTLFGIIGCIYTHSMNIFLRKQAWTIRLNCMITVRQISAKYSDRIKTIS